MKRIVILLNIIFVFLINLFGVTKVGSQETVQRVFNQLTTTVGDYSNVLPKVVIRAEKRFGASYKRSENTIFIEQTALDICASFGADEESAIAFLLGHELTHYYQKHDWQETGFTTGFLTSVDTYQKNIHNEKEADTYSAFITHLAGYNSIKILPKLLEEIYEIYKLKGKVLNNYPTLSERKALANNVCKTVQGLIDIYQAANYLYALGKYEDALVSYEYLLKYVKYKELYNNIGLCALYVALPVIERDFPFIYPLTLDPTVPLREPSGFTKEELIEKAINSFATATNYDPSYFLSYLNLMCAYDLNKQFYETRSLMSSIQKLAIQPKQREQLTILEGVIAFRNGKISLAKKYFSTVSHKAIFPELAAIANLNIQVLNGEKLEKVTSSHFPSLEDKIEGVNLLFYESENKESSYVLQNTSLDKKSLEIKNLNNSKIYLFNSNEQLTKFQCSKSVTQKTKEGIGIGTTIAQIELVYSGTKQRLVPHLNGYYLLLPLKGILFNLGKNNRVTEWGLFID